MRVIEKNLSFADHEVILQIIHPHGFFMAGRFFLAAIILGIPFFFMFPLFRLGKWGIGIFIILVAVAFFLALRAFLLWYYNVLVLTTQRVFLIQQKGIFERDIAEIMLEDVSDISFKKKGIPALFFGYANLCIVGSKNNKELLFCVCPKPQNVSASIQSAADKIVGKYNEDRVVMKLQKMKDSLGEEQFKKAFKKIK